MNIFAKQSATVSLLRLVPLLGGCYHPTFRKEDDTAATGTVGESLSEGGTHTTGQTDSSTASNESGNTSESDGNLGICGDQQLDPSETCDDGNDIPYDGCEPNCQSTPLGVLTTGYYFTCTLVKDGKIRCWGNNEWGQLGIGNTEMVGDDEPPKQVEPVDLGSQATQITAGGYHVCALLSGGSVACWGNGSYGRLGYGSIDNIGDSEFPGGGVDLGGPAIQISAGGAHTCALLAGVDGKVRCWGSGIDGQLGYGNIKDVGDTMNTLPSLSQFVSLDAPAIQIATGHDHSCAILENGKIRCWGSGEHGRLGYENTDDAKCLNQFGQFSCMENDQDGSQNSECCIGDDELPTFITEPIDLGEKVVQLALGWRHSCALLQNGNVFCWGLGDDGRLGYGNIIGTMCLNQSDQFACTQNDKDGDENLKCCIGDNDHPTAAGAVDLGGKAVQIVTRSDHTCALLENGDVRCWGQNGYGQLGYGHTNNIGDDETPSSQAPLKLGAKAIQLAAGDYHTCALLEGGDIQCWGYGEDGQLGYGNTAENCIVTNQFSCQANSFCCIGDKSDEMPPDPVSFK